MTNDEYLDRVKKAIDRHMGTNSTQWRDLPQDKANTKFLTQPEAPDELLKKFPRTYREKFEEMRMILSSYQGRRYVQMRVYESKDGGKTWLATTRGMSIKKQEIDAVIETLKLAKEKISGV